MVGEDVNQQAGQITTPVDSQYYYENAIFLVDGTLFKVPRESLGKSDTISMMFHLPLINGSSEGETNENPIRLDGIDNANFKTLMKLFFPFSSLSGDITSVDLSVIEWRSVLKLATMWDMVEVRHLAIQKIGAMTVDPVSKAVMARDFDVLGWLVPALEALVSMEREPTLGEGHSLGMEWVLMWSEARHIRAAQALHNSRAGRAHWPAWLAWLAPDTPLQIIVCTIFRLNPDGTANKYETEEEDVP